MREELIGMSTDVNGVPDINILDIGYHLTNWNKSNSGQTTLYCDFNNDCTVDTHDLLFFLEYWLYNYEENYIRWVCDFNDNGRVDIGDLALLAEDWLYLDLKDFAIFAKYWLQEVDYKFQDKRPDTNGDGIVNFKDWAIFGQEWYKTKEPIPTLEVRVYGDPNEGIEVGVANYSPTIERVFLFMDGKPFGELINFEEGECLEIEMIDEYNGRHQFKAVGLNEDGRIICSSIVEENFNGLLSDLHCSEYFSPDKPFYFSGLYQQGSNHIVVRVVDMNDKEVWSHLYSTTEGQINGVIPAGTLTSGFYEIIFQEVERGLKLAIKDKEYKEWVKKVSEEFVQNKVSQNVRGLIICPNVAVTKKKYKVAVECFQAFNRHRIEPVILYHENATYDNLKWLLENRDIEYLNFIGHGNCEFKKNLITLIQLYDALAVSCKISDFLPGRAPPFCLPPEQEDMVKSILSIRIQIGQLKLVFLDTCMSGRLRLTHDWRLIEGPDAEDYPPDIGQNDMSYAFRIQNSNQVLKGWYNLAWAKRIFTYYNKWSLNFWHALKDDYCSVDCAIEYAIVNTPGVTLREAPHTSYRFRSPGCELNSIRLR